MALEDIEKELYGLKRGRARGAAPRKMKQRAAPPSVPAPPPVWEEREVEEPEEGKRGVWRIILFGSVFILVLAVLGVAAFLIFSPGEESRGVQITSYAPSEINRGVPFEFVVNAENQLDTVLRAATITIDLPSGIVSLSGFGPRTNFVTEEVGDIGGRTVARKTFRLLPVGPSESLQKVDVKLSYGTGGRSRFEAREGKEIMIGQPAVKVEVLGPERVLVGSSFELEVKYENISKFNFEDITLEVGYPTSFRFASANPLAPDSLDNYWKLGALEAGSRGTLRVKGFFESAPAGGESRFAFPVTLAAAFLGKDYPLVEEEAAVALAPAPIRLGTLVNGRSDYVARAGDHLSYLIRYQNDSGISLADVVVRVTLTGELFNIATVDTGGSLNSVANTITWTAANTPGLRLLEPGASGEASFDLELKPSFPIRRLGDKNYTLRVQVHVDSPSVPSYLSADKTSADALFETKVAGQVTLDAQAFYRDAPAGIVNAGVLPPQVNQPTEYTLHWVIRSYAADLKDVKVRAYLASGVVWTGQVKSYNVDTLPLWNERTQEVTWDISKIAANRGVVGSPVEVIFQVRATPNVTQVGQYMALMGESELRATEDFTGLELMSRDAGLSTALPDDRTVGGDAGKVVP